MTFGYKELGVIYDEKKLTEWHDRFGLELSLWLDKLLASEWYISGGKNLIYLKFGKKCHHDPQKYKLSLKVFSKGEEVPNLLGKLLGKKPCRRGKLIVISTVPRT